MVIVQGPGALGKPQYLGCRSSQTLGGCLTHGHTGVWAEYDGKTVLYLQSQEVE